MGACTLPFNLSASASHYNTTPTWLANHGASSASNLYSEGNTNTANYTIYLDMVPHKYRKNLIGGAETHQECVHDDVNGTTTDPACGGVINEHRYRIDNPNSSHQTCIHVDVFSGTTTDPACGGVVNQHKYSCSVGGCAHTDTMSDPYTSSTCNDACSPKPIPCGTYGDVNNNGVITTTDALQVREFLAGTRTFTALQIEKADVDDAPAAVSVAADVTAADADIIEQYAKGLITTFPVCTPLLTGACGGSPDPADIGQNVTWTASPTGGTGSYAYNWSGTDGLAGTVQSIVKQYLTFGTKNATVAIASGSQTTNASCAVEVNVPPLTATCSGSPDPAALGHSVTWSATPSGGTGIYAYSWTGTDGLTGTTQTTEKSYSSSGTKTASVTVTSDTQTTIASCQVLVSPPLSVGCDVDPNPAVVGQSVQWTTFASGGASGYTYSWAGTDGLSGNTASIEKSYTTSGTKTGTITVISGPETKSATCETKVAEPILQVSCVAQPNPATIGQNVTWSALTSGGSGILAYSWSGTDGLSGSTKAVVKSYSTTGLKEGTVVVKSGTQSKNATCDVVVKNPPVADATVAAVAEGPYVKEISARPGETLYFFASKDGNGDGQASYDPDGGALTEYKWDFNGSNPISGAEYVSSSTGDTTFVYANVGVYNARLLVVDNENESAFEDITVTITDELIASCAATPNPQQVQKSVSWKGTLKGASGSITWNWAFDDNEDGKYDLFVFGNPVSRIYLETGLKKADLTVRAGSKVAKASCTESVIGPCTSNCSTEGARQCKSSTSYQVCTKTKDGCLIWSPEPAARCPPSAPICTSAGQCI